MSLQQKYARLIEYAQKSGVQKLSVQEQGNVLYITGATDPSTKEAIWNLYNTIDPDMRAGDLVLKIEDSGEPAKETIHEVQKDESLSTIAKKYSGMTWQKIFEANKDIIKDPNVVIAGQKLRIPVGASSQETIYEVQKNENLSVIAAKFPGMTWQKIFEANKDVLKDPDKVMVGQKLRIPSK